MYYHIRIILGPVLFICWKHIYWPDCDLQCMMCSKSTCAEVILFHSLFNTQQQISCSHSQKPAKYSNKELEDNNINPNFIITYSDLYNLLLKSMKSAYITTSNIFRAIFYVLIFCYIFWHGEMRDSGFA